MSTIGGPGAIGGVGGGRTMQDILAMRQQVLDQNQLLKDLRQSATQSAESAKGPAPLPASDTPDAGGGFADTLKGALQDVSATQRRASELAAAYERGEVTDIAQVMLARQESGLAFEATLQVRNKLMSAYQEIMRMGV